MKQNELNDDNFMIFAIKHYRNPSCTGMDELEDDLKRFKYLKRLFNRYEKDRRTKRKVNNKSFSTSI